MPPKPRLFGNASDARGMRPTPNYDTTTDPQVLRAGGERGDISQADVQSGMGDMAARIRAAGETGQMSQADVVEATNRLPKPGALGRLRALMGPKKEQ